MDDPNARQHEDSCENEFTVHSPGLWNLKDANKFLEFSLPKLHVQLGIIFIFTHSIHMVLKRFHVARNVSETLAGLILGPSVLGQIPKFTITMFPPTSAVYLDLIAKTGFIFHMFLIGVKMEPGMVLKSGKKVWTLAFASVIIPVFVGMSVSQTMDPFLTLTSGPIVKNIILIQTFSPFPQVACLLNDLKMANSELGRLALAIGLIRELLSLGLHTPLNYIRVATQGGSNVAAGQTFFMFLIFIMTTMLVLHPVFLWIIRQTPEGKSVDAAYIGIICFGVSLSAFLSYLLGAHFYYIGPLILGLAVPVGPPLGSTLEEKLDTVITGFFTPVLMTFCGLRTNVYTIQNVVIMHMIWTIIGMGLVVNFLGSFLPALFWRIPLKDAATLALILSTQGIVEMAGIHAYMQNKTLTEEAFSIVTVSVLLTSLFIPYLVRSIYDYSRVYIGYQNRNILHAPENGELRIFVCVHREDEAMAAIKLLEVSNPTRESPLQVHILHLMELKGRATPLLINHKLGQKVSAVSRSRPIIDAFNVYETQYSGLVNVDAFTAISMPKFMHHDICSLAFDKLTSLLVLPFHRKWNAQGTMIMDNSTFRSINHQVLELAPCSVGILVDRRKMQRTMPASPLYRVAVLFIGGDDDREALAYAKRMANSPAVHLTVYRIVAAENVGMDSWETMLDTQNLKDIKLLSSHRGNVMYKEEKVKDGPGTARVIRTMEEIYDLIMVGRRHRLDSPVLSGILDWTELPEFGALGDLLASQDITQPASVLVVQQQHTNFGKKKN